jgi:hypothetical protein
MIVVHSFTSQQASYLGAIFQVGGIIGGLACSSYMSKKNAPSKREDTGVLREAPYIGVFIAVSVGTLISKI